MSTGALKDAVKTREYVDSWCVRGRSMSFGQYCRGGGKTRARRERGEVKPGRGGGGEKSKGGRERWIEKDRDRGRERERKWGNPDILGYKGENPRARTRGRKAREGEKMGENSPTSLATGEKSEGENASTGKESK